MNAGSKSSRSAAVAILAALAMASAACGFVSSEPTAAPAPAGPQESSGEHNPAFGASLDEFLESEVEQPEASTPPDGYEEIDWEDLMPPDFSETEAEISAKFDELMADVEPGSAEANEIFEEIQADYADQPVNPALAGNEIQLAGFVAPLTYDGDLITEFLLVPYFGACIHVPPPPVNQTVLVTLQDGQGLGIDESWGAVWVTGTMGIEGGETDLATAGYSINNAQTGVYDNY